MPYVSAFVAAVPNANKEKYLAMATRMDKFFKEKGALRAVECWGSDVPDGEVTSFPKAVRKGDEETVAFGWIEWPSKELADKVMQEMMSGSGPDEPMPFDGRRLIFGGFDVILEV